MTLIWAVKEERPPLPDGRDGLARSFMHIANQCPVNLYRRSVNLETTTVNGKRSAKRLAFGAWGLVPKWWVVELLRAPVSVQMECRSTWRSRDCLPKDGTRRWVKNCWSRGQVVRLLLWSAEVEYRPSWLLRFRYTNCGAGERKAHRCNGALLSEAKPTTLGMAWLWSFWTGKASRPLALQEEEQPRRTVKRGATEQKLIKPGSLCMFVAKTSSVAKEHLGAHPEDQ